jgi:hypothetical protein
VRQKRKNKKKNLGVRFREAKTLRNAYLTSGDPQAEKNVFLLEILSSKKVTFF